MEDLHWYPFSLTQQKSNFSLFQKKANSLLYTILTWQKVSQEPLLLDRRKLNLVHVKGMMLWAEHREAPVQLAQCLMCYVLSHFSCVSDSMDCSLPGSSVHGIFQARILELVAISFSRGSSQPRDRASVSCLADGFFTPEPPGKPSVLSTSS